MMFLSTENVLLQWSLCVLASMHCTNNLARQYVLFFPCQDNWLGGAGYPGAFSEGEYVPSFLCLSVSERASACIMASFTKAMAVARLLHQGICEC